MTDVLAFLLKKEVIGTIITAISIYLAFSLIRVIADKILSRSATEFEKKRKKTVVNLLKTVLKWVVIMIALIIVLDLFGVNVNSLIASLGVASAVGALALQDSLKDIINGASMIMDNYFVVGDIIKYGDFMGTVIELGLRTTKIMNADGEVKVISNRNISEVTNLSQKEQSALLIAPTAYEEKIEKVEKILNEIVEEIKTWDTMNKKKTAYIGITELESSCVNYGIRIYCSGGKIWEYKRAVLRLIKQKYDKNKIKIPYNQIEVHNER
ncbi:MAG TPA: hypothetical protein DCY94_03885 [Firmicutes bacterium]|nr:hypothetical protein [Bacillota bacterium]